MKTIKNLSAMLVLALVFMFASNAVKAQSDNSFEGRARGELNNCLGDANRDDFEVSSSVTSTCVDGNGEVTVTFIGTRRCAPFEPCPRIARLIGFVTFDCEGNVIAAQCGVTPL